MSNEDVKFSVGAEDTGVGVALAGVQERVTEFAEGVQAQMEMLTGAFEKVQGAFIAFTAILAGGSAFKEALESTVNMTKESMALGRQFGISATDASVLKVAMASVFVTQDQMSAGAGKITMALKKNESAFTDLGVATRDSNGNFLSTSVIMQATNERLMEFKEGVDRNVEGVKIYGRAWNEIAPILKVTQEVMDEARVKADALGLTIGAESVAAVQKYRGAMNDTHEVFEAFEKAIGDALLPSLTQLGEWFGEMGPSVILVTRVAIDQLSFSFAALRDACGALLSAIGAIFTSIGDAVLGVFGQSSAPVTALEFFTNVLRVLSVTFITIGTVINVAIEGILETVQMMADSLIRLGSLSTAVFNALSGQGKWGDILGAWEAGSKDMENHALKHEQNMLDIIVKGKEATDHALLDQAGAAPKMTAIQAASGGETSDGGDEKLKSQMAAFQAQLAAAKIHYEETESLNGQYIEFSKQQEIDFWQSKLKSAVAGSGDAQKVQENIDKLEYEKRKEGFESELADLKAQQSKYKNNLEAKLALAIEYANKVAAANGGDSSKAKEAQAQVLAIDREIDAQRLELAKINQTAMDNIALGSITSEEKAAQARVANHLETNAQLIAQQRTFEAQRLQIAMDGIIAQQAAAQKDPNENVKLLAQLNAQKLALMTQYNTKMAELNLKSADDSAKDWKKTFTTLTSGFQNVVQGMLQGTMTFQGAITSMYKTITGIISQTISQMVTTWLEGEVSKMIATKTGAATQVADNAAVAGSGAFAATAVIPYVGPELAPAAAAAAYAASLSFGAGLSAEGGYDIPAGINPMVQTHQREMILPAEHADTIRSLKGSGGNSKRADAAMARNFRQQTAALKKQIKKSSNRFV
jgi:hypothetical protein